MPSAIGTDKSNKVVRVLRLRLKNRHIATFREKAYWVNQVMTTLNKHTPEETAQFFAAANLLTDDQKQEAMRELLDTAGATEAGIIRQILDNPEKKLSAKQQFVYDNTILPSMAERCANYNSCKSFTAAGVEYCGSCEVEYGS